MAPTLLLGRRLVGRQRGRLRRAACLRRCKQVLLRRRLQTLSMQLREPQLSQQALAKLPSCFLGCKREQPHQQARLTQQTGLMSRPGLPSTVEQPQRARQPYLHLLAPRQPRLPARERLQRPAPDRDQLALQQQKQRLWLQMGSRGQQGCQQRLVGVQQPLEGKLWSRWLRRPAQRMLPPQSHGCQQEGLARLLRPAEASWSPRPRQQLEQERAWRVVAQRMQVSLAPC